MTKYREPQDTTVKSRMMTGLGTIVFARELKSSKVSRLIKIYHKLFRDIQQDISIPPKGVVPNLFGERKVFIGTLDGGTWHEFVQIDKPHSILIEPADKSEPIDFNPIEIELKFRPMKVSEDILRRFGICNFRKPCKTTYKTLRHDCAKRNGRR